MLEINDLSKSFDGFAALDHASMHIDDGCIYGLVGPNGAGKTTIIRHIAGALRPDNGTVLYNGQPVYENPEVKQHFAYIPDDVFYHHGDNLNDLRRFYRGLYPNFDDELFDRLSEAFPAIDRKKHIRSLSKGMQKQAAFWLSICTRPDFMILDEPVDGLDPVMRRQIWSLIMSDVSGRGTTVLISSHNLRELEDVCDHVGIMDKGRVLLERSLEELQGNVSKYQIILNEGAALPEGLNILHESTIGRVTTLIIRGAIEDVSAQLRPLSPALLDVLPLSLEEIFIYEMGGENYAVHEILL